MHRERPYNQIRKTIITPYYLEKHPASVLIEMGYTKVLCGATIEEKTPYFLKNSDVGWITAEYAMLPCSGDGRNNRDNGTHRNGRNMEIQRLIGRCLRTAFNLQYVKDLTVTIDCDVIQADGGTRTAAITGSFVAAMLAFQMRNISPHVCEKKIAAISVGMVHNEILLDLDYHDDSQAQVDCNIVMDEEGRIIEIQGTGEKKPFTLSELDTILSLGFAGIQEIMLLQEQALQIKPPPSCT
jgi:ribonuclease PH